LLDKPIEATVGVGQSVDEVSELEGGKQLAPLGSAALAGS